jgi:hypothetical protein
MIELRIWGELFFSEILKCEEMFSVFPSYDLPSSSTEIRTIQHFMLIFHYPRPDRWPIPSSLCWVMVVSDRHFLWRHEVLYMSSCERYSDTHDPLGNISRYWFKIVSRSEDQTSLLLPFFHQFIFCLVVEREYSWPCGRIIMKTPILAAERVSPRDVMAREWHPKPFLNSAKSSGLHSSCSFCVWLSDDTSRFPYALERHFLSATSSHIMRIFGAFVIKSEVDCEERKHLESGRTVIPWIGIWPCDEINPLFVLRKKLGARAWFTNAHLYYRFAATSVPSGCRVDESSDPRLLWIFRSFTDKYKVASRLKKQKLAFIQVFLTLLLVGATSYTRKTPIASSTYRPSRWLRMRCFLSPLRRLNQSISSTGRECVVCVLSIDRIHHRNSDWSGSSKRRLLVFLGLSKDRDQLLLIDLPQFSDTREIGP